MQRKVRKSLTFLMALVMVMSLVCGSGFSVIAEETGLTELTADGSTETEVMQSAAYETEMPASIQEETTGGPETEPVQEETGRNEGMVPSETPAEETGENGTELPGDTEASENVTENVTENASEAVSETASEAGSENVTEEESSEKESETEKITEETRPEFTYNTTVDGIVVNIHAPEGILPVGTTVTVKPLAEDVLDTAERTINDTLEKKEVVQLIGFDITFYDADGKEMHDLDGAVRVEYSGMDIVDEAEEARVYHADENGNITNTLTAAAEPSGTVGFTSDTFSPVLYAVYAENDGVSAYAISGPDTVEAGKTITLTSGNTANSSWESSDSTIASVNSGGVVTGKKPGKVTITHRYCNNDSWYHSHGWNCNSNGIETYQVTVTEAAPSKNEGARVYYLLTPTSDPDSNATNQWGDVVQYYGNNATVKIPNDATWTAGTDGSTENIVRKNTDISGYIVSWPDGTANGAAWTLNRDYYLNTVYQAVYNNYKEQLKTDLGIADLQLDDIEEITLIPYKISRNNGTSPDKHIDCTISVVCSKAYVARFNVQMPGETGYTNVSAENKKIVKGVPDAVQKYTNEQTIPETKVVDGITYKFDGWYNEAGNKIADDGWDYTPNTSELADGTVNFYARYIPATTSIIVEKNVTGGLGDYTKEFHFNYSCGSETGSFTLKNGEKQTIENIPVDMELTLTETDANGYITSAVYGDASQNAVDGTMKFTINTTDKKIVVTNNREGYPDTGISLDSLPYIVILVIVLAGAVLFVISRQRKQRINNRRRK